jgi:hypothetical protein
MDSTPSITINARLAYQWIGDLSLYDLLLPVDAARATCLTMSRLSIYYVSSIHTDQVSYYQNRGAGQHRLVIRISRGQGRHLVGGSALSFVDGPLDTP